MLTIRSRTVLVLAAAVLVCAETGPKQPTALKGTITSSRSLSRTHRRHLETCDLELCSLNGSFGFSVNGIKGSGAGHAVSIGGDFNGDSVDDFVVGAPLPAAGSKAGAIYVVFGSRSEFGSVFDLASMEPPAVGRYGVALKSIWRSETEGTTFALTCGDFNGDGLADVALGDSAAGGRGHVYVVFGSSSESEGPLDLAELDGENGFAVAGLRNGDRFGFSVALNGDVNDDGLKDLVIGAPGASMGRGQVFVIFGSTSAMPSVVDPTDASQAHVMNGVRAGDRAGHAVGAADFNGDGIDDILISAPDANQGRILRAGQAYVVFGSESEERGPRDPLDLAVLATADGYETGVMINGAVAGGRVGFSLSAGDINGDSIKDIVLGARGPDGESGAVHVLWGSERGFGGPMDLGAVDGTNGFTLLQAGGLLDAEMGVLVSAGGDLNGDGLSDLVIGSGVVPPSSGLSAGPDKDGTGPGYGHVLVVFGSASRFSRTGSTALTRLRLDDGSEGFRLRGFAVGSRGVVRVSSGGDVNGDGLDDLVVGSETADPWGSTGTGQAFVVYGRRDTCEFCEASRCQEGEECANTERGFVCTCASGLMDPSETGQDATFATTRCHEPLAGDMENWLILALTVSGVMGGTICGVACCLFLTRQSVAVHDGPKEVNEGTVSVAVASHSNHDDLRPAPGAKTRRAASFVATNATYGRRRSAGPDEVHAVPCTRPGS